MKILVVLLLICVVCVKAEGESGDGDCTHSPEENICTNDVEDEWHEFALSSDTVRLSADHLDDLREDVDRQLMSMKSFMEVYDSLDTSKEFQDFGSNVKRRSRFRPLCAFLHDRALSRGVKLPRVVGLLKAFLGLFKYIEAAQYWLHLDLFDEMVNMEVLVDPVHAVSMAGRAYRRETTGFSNDCSECLLRKLNYEPASSKLFKECCAGEKLFFAESQEEQSDLETYVQEKESDDNAPKVLKLKA